MHKFLGNGLNNIFVGTLKKCYRITIARHNRLLHNWSSKELRTSFISYYEGRGHKWIRSSPVVPWNDESLEFVNAGMNQVCHRLSASSLLDGPGCA